MKKSVIFSILLIFLTVGLWGQTTYTWIGGGDPNDWNDDDNWDNGSPGDGDQLYTITIPAGFNVKFDGASLICDILTIASGASLDMGVFNLTVDTTLDNNGTIRLVGTQTVTPAVIGGTGAVEFTGTGTTFAGLTSFYNLTIVNGARTAPASITVSGTTTISGGSLNTFTGLSNLGNLTMTAGTLTLGGDVVFNDVNLVAGSTFTPGAHTLTVNGSWTRNGTFNSAGSTVAFNGSTVNGNNTFNIVTAAGNVTFTGSNTIATLTVTGTGPAVYFAGDSTQIITNLDTSVSTGAVLSKIAADSAQWRVNVLTAANFKTNNSTTISWCNAANSLNRITTGTSLTSAVNGGNNTNVFIVNDFIWTGGTDSDWIKGSNWDVGSSPLNGNSSYTIIIQSGTFPVFSGTGLNCNRLEISAGMTLNMSSYDLTVTLLDITGGTIINGGDIKVGDELRLDSGSISAASIEITGESYTGGTITTTGDQTYSDAVFLLNDTVINAGSGEVQFESTISGDNATARSLSITASDINFHDVVGSSIPALNPINNLTIICDGILIDVNITTQGAVTINNSGTFTLNVDLTANGGFTQSGNGLNDLGANITTNGYNLSFNTNINLIDDIQLNTGAGAGNITLKNVVTNAPGFNLEMTSGTGNISVIDIGQTNRLGTITISSNGGNNEFKGKISARNFTQSGSGTTTFTGAQDYLESFTFTGNNLIINDELKTNTNGIGNDGKITITGNTANNGKIICGSVSSDPAVDFQGNYISSTSAELDGSATTEEIWFGGNVKLNSVTINNNRIVFYNAPGHSPSTIEIDSAVLLKNVLIKRSSTVNVLAGTVIRQIDGSTLEFEDRAGPADGDRAVLNVVSAYWYIRTTGTETGNNFNGYAGKLTLGDGAVLYADNVFLGGGSPGGFVVENGNDSQISAAGNVVIDGTTLSDPDAPGYNVAPGSTLSFNPTNLPKLIISMSGNGKSLTVKQPIGILRINKNAEITLNNDLVLRGGLKIEGDKNLTADFGVFNAGNNNIILYAGLYDTKESSAVKLGRWEVNGPETIGAGNVPTYSMSSFKQNLGASVIFKKEPGTIEKTYFEILGNTTWQKFICHEPGAIIQFSQYPDQHVFLDLFDIEGEDGKNVILTRLDKPWIYPDPENPNAVPPGASGGTVDNSLPKVPASRNLKNDAAERVKFWNFNIVVQGESGAKKLHIKYVTIYFSHAWNQRIPIDIEIMKLKATPFYRFDGVTRIGYFNYDWIQVRKIIYSFVEDSNGNGKADRIRIQSNVQINGDFSKFKVEIEGYDVDTGRGKMARGDGRSNGYDEVYNHTNDPLDTASFYIFLKEKPYPYDGKAIKWWVVENDSLKDDISQEMPVGTPVAGDSETDEIFYTINTIPPRISYTLTIPGHDWMYVRMTQPVSANSGDVTVNGSNKQALSQWIVNNETDDSLSSFKLEYFYLFSSNPKLYDLKQPVPLGVLSYLIPLQSSPSLSAMAQSPPVGNGTIASEYYILDNLENLGVRALDWNDDQIDEDSYMYYPSPRYPVNLNYHVKNGNDTNPTYLTYKGNSHVQGNVTDDSAFLANPDKDTKIFLPPYRLLTPEMMRRLEEYAASLSSVAPVEPGDFNTPGIDKSRRITDVLVSRSPFGNSENYFAWPVWAKSKDSVNINPGGAFFEESDAGLIWYFDGTKYLEDKEEYTLQARINNELLKDFNGLSLFYGYNVGEEWREPSVKGERGKGSGGLWLPESSQTVNPLFYIVPSENTGSVDKGLLTFYPARIPEKTVSTPPLFTFDFKKPDSNVSNSGEKVDFFLRLEGKSGVEPALFIARLDAKEGVDLNTLEWWKLIRPFSFDIQNARLQRGGVTILNNVINSNEKENVFIRYNLARPGRVTVQVYTLDGTLVKSLRRNEQREAGVYTDAWNGTNNSGRSVARGMYFVRVTGPDIDEIRKIMVIKK